MTRLYELLRAHNWRTLRAIFRAHRARFDNRWTKAQAVERTAALLTEPASIRRALEALPDDAHEALETLLACDGTMAAHRFLAHFGPLRPYRPWRADSPRTPWRHPASPAERLWFLGLIFRCRAPEGEAIVIPDEVRPLLPAPPPPPTVEPTAPAPPVPDSILDIGHVLAFLQGHEVRPFAGRWITPRHLRTLNRALTHADPSAATARSELQTGYLRFLHYLAEAAGLVGPVASLLKPTTAAWSWLDASEANRWQALWDGWQGDLQHAPRERSLWQRFRLPGERPFVRTALDTLARLPDGDWWEPREIANRLRRRCIGADTLPRDGDALAALGELLLGPLTWAAMVRTNAEEQCAFTPLGEWLLGRSAKSPAPPATQAAEVHTSDRGVTVTLPEPPERPSLRPLVELALPPAGAGRPVRRLTRERFVAGQARGTTGAQVARTLGALTGATPTPAIVARLERWETEAQGLRVRRLTVLSAGDPQVLTELSAERSIRPHFDETLSPHHVAVDPARVEHLLRALRRRDHVPLVEPGAAPPPAHGEPADDEAAGYVWLALRTYVELGDLVRLPAVPPAALLDRVGVALEADQLAAVAAQAEQACDRLRDALDGYTPFPAPLEGVDHAAIRTQIEQALADGQAVEMVYHTAGRGERTTRVVEPLRLEEHRGAVYLIAFCRLRQAERVFRADRIESLVVSS